MKLVIVGKLYFNVRNKSIACLIQMKNQMSVFDSLIDENLVTHSSGPQTRKTYNLSNFIDNFLLKC
jgi:hypothetical protein